tara:strand:- start:682 stop:876 length:195 start_codon:yes stop_codon:yes gene_type:complete
LTTSNAKNLYKIKVIIGGNARTIVCDKGSDIYPSPISKKISLKKTKPRKVSGKKIKFIPINLIA